MSSPSQEPVAAEDGRPTDQACRLLLAAVGGEPPDPAPVRKYVVSDSGFAAADRIGAAAKGNQSGRRRRVEGEVSEKSLGNTAIRGVCSRIQIGMDFMCQVCRGPSLRMPEC